MALTYPLSIPSDLKASEIEFIARSVVGQSSSPFTGEEQVYVHQGEWWEMNVVIQPQKIANAAAVIAFLLSLNGRQGTFLMGDPSFTSPRGTWAGSPKVLGAHSAGVKTIAMDGFTASATVKAGDWFQIGTGSSSRLHQVVQDGTADGSGLLNIEIWPRTRAALADDATFTTSSPKGVWRLASNSRSWSVGRAKIYGIRFAAVEALNP